MEHNQSLLGNYETPRIMHPANEILCWLQLVTLHMDRVREINKTEQILSTKAEQYINYVCDIVLREALTSLEQPALLERKLDKQEYKQVYMKKRYKDRKHLARSLTKILGEDSTEYKVWKLAYDGKKEVRR